jgi:hypothetical protein
VAPAATTPSAIVAAAPAATHYYTAEEGKEGKQTKHSFPIAPLPRDTEEQNTG